MKSHTHRFRSAFSILILFLIIIQSRAQNDSNLLLLSDRDKKIENQIQFAISKADFNKIKTSKGVKISLKNPLAIVNGDSITVKDIHLRGQTTLYLRRKSYEIKADDKMIVYHDGKKQSMKELLAVSLSMDKNYIRNRLSFELMEKLQLFKLFYAFAELGINGETQGIYMILEPPIVWALKDQQSPLIIRRGYDHKIEKIKAGKGIEMMEEKLYQDHYFKIYQALHKFKGKDLYDKLNNYIDLEMYMKWLAFNYIVRNGDYSDEVFLYIDPKDARFKVIPWDYDDIFASSPHEGTGHNWQNNGDKYIFSSEDELDNKIAGDPYLHNIYLKCLKWVLNEMTDQIIKEVLEKTYSELFPYFSNAEVINMSQYDVYKQATLSSLYTDLSLIYTNLLLTRRTILKALE